MFPTPGAIVEFAPVDGYIGGWGAASPGNSALILGMGAGEGGRGEFKIANGTVGFRPQEDISLFDSNQQPVPPSGVLGLNVDAGTVDFFQVQRQFLQPDTSSLLATEPSATQALLGGFPPHEIFVDDAVTNASLAPLQATLDQSNDPSIHQIQFNLACSMPFGLPSAPSCAWTSQNTDFDFTPDPGFGTSYATLAESPDTAPSSGTWFSAMSFTPSLATSPTSPVDPRPGPYKCKYPGCKSKYTWPTRAKLKRHQRYHKKPHKCTTSNCERAFTNKRDLDRHMETHSKDVTKSPCPFLGCGKTYKRKDNMLKHLKKHGEDASVQEGPPKDIGKLGCSAFRAPGGRVSVTGSNRAMRPRQVGHAE
ncbi:hypothetical protein QBC45DRAFT_490265 [Copromyces sp. CBS 386.78]|nr:hypothetical protein QBC45DRAFT_490265 [Copromyces sp. CBS 386.78]